MRERLKQELILPKGAQNIRARLVGEKVEILFEKIPQEEIKRTREEIKGTQEYIEKYFPVAKLSNISLEDEFLNYKPETDNQKKFKERLVKAIKSGLSDIRVQRMDPSFDSKGNIYFCKGKKPAIGKSIGKDIYCWPEKAAEFLPEYESRIGRTKEKIGCLGLLIKYLVEENGYTLSNAWRAVCDNSIDLGHSADDGWPDWEPTGSKQIGDWCDLGNTSKITLDENFDFRIVGGNFMFGSCYAPLAKISTIECIINDLGDSVGWIVLSKVEPNPVTPRITKWRRL